ncbi:hypothetical protein CRG98_007317 [Punica granatum]|uniref:Uncharacterized protein n=1 Tax=Punica granatum TaxID=22663 RepID=A0A2I0KV70_PUNGR|nr:hypothetical protein CRG98_007317 [Punica granatum]
MARGLKKPVLLHLDDRSEVVRFYLLFVPLCVVLFVSACFRVSFIYLWIGYPGSPVRKASANVRECLGLSRRLLKCARSPCPRASVFASVGPIVNSDPGFGWVTFVEAGGPKWGANSEVGYVVSKYMPSAFYGGLFRGSGKRPSEGCVTDKREKKSPLPVYDPRVEGQTKRGISSHVEELVRYPRTMIHETMVVDFPHESKLRSIKSTRLRQKSKSTLKTAVRPVELPGDSLIAIHTPVPSYLSYRHYSKQGSDSGLDPVPHSGCAHSICMGALDPVIDGLKALDPVQSVTYRLGLEPQQNSK